jgi:serine-type D-Ala-D-Ala carboxypeptidase (penicillin-binding protein 5/6)
MSTRLFSTYLLACHAIAAWLLSTHAHAQVPAPQINAKAWVLYDHSAQTTLGSENASQRVEPASLTKLMTAYLVFAALKAKTISEGQAVPVSTRAWKAPGSRMFIEPNKPVTVAELLRGMIIQSGNDASVALAELVAGSEEQFATRMNQQAKALGMKGTNFTNSTGLPDPQHYTTGEDMAVLAAAVIREFPEHYALYAQKEYTYNNISQPNRNRLLFMDPTVDGVKTGHTEAAGYCLVASARRTVGTGANAAERRLISVVLGATGDTARAVESQKLLNHGFLNFDSVRYYQKGQSVATLQVWKGEAKEVKLGFERDLMLTLPKGQLEKVKANLVTPKHLIAPLQMGQKVGEVQVMLDGKEIAKVPLHALAAVPQAGVFSRMVDTVRLWFNKG